jgi:hypothetical protein
VPEVLLAANAMKAGMEILRPLLAETGADPIGKMVIGTVKGDIHDIGKNLVGDDAGRRGLRGRSTSASTIRSRSTSTRSRAQARHPRHVGAAHHHDALHEGGHRHARQEKGLREDYIVLVGGAPLNEEFGKAIGADAYCRDAAVAVETAKQFMTWKRTTRWRPPDRSRLRAPSLRAPSSRTGHDEADETLPSFSRRRVLRLNGRAAARCSSPAEPWREIVDLVEANRWSGFDIQCLPAIWHNTP